LNSRQLRIDTQPKTPYSGKCVIGPYVFVGIPLNDPAETARSSPRSGAMVGKGHLAAGHARTHVEEQVVCVRRVTIPHD